MWDKVYVVLLVFICVFVLLMEIIEKFVELFLLILLLKFGWILICGLFSVMVRFRLCFIKCLLVFISCVIILFL